MELARAQEYSMFDEVNAYYTSCGYTISSLKSNSRGLTFFIKNARESYFCHYLENKNPAVGDIKAAFIEINEQNTNRDTNIIFINCDSLDPALSAYEDMNTIFMTRTKMSRLHALKQRIGRQYKHIQLHAHNEYAYDQYIKNKQDRNAFVRATGTGKSYLIARIAQDFYPNNLVVATPNRFIIEQQQKAIHTDNVNYHTYQELALEEGGFTLPDNTAAVFCDEFHRLGARTWQKGFLASVENHDITLIGMSATHIRYLDDERNMADELFDGNIIAPLTLPTAIVKGILKEPTYISALYDFNDSADAIRRRIHRSDGSQCQKASLLDSLRGLELDWERSNGVADLINDHLLKLDGHYIVFCEDMAHMQELKSAMKKWLKKAAELRGEASLDIRISTLYSKQGTLKNKSILDQFEQSDTGINLLFTIDMLNEGKHIDHVDGIFLFRRTTSPIIYYQQIGRCFSVSSAKSPIIFDLVSNINAIQELSLGDQLKFEMQKENQKRSALSLNPVKLTGTVKSIVETFTDKMRAIEGKAESIALNFHDTLKLLKQYKQENGHFSIYSHEEYKGIHLGKKITRIRVMKRDGLLSQEQENALNAIGFPFDFYAYQFERYTCALEAFHERHGHTLVPPKVQCAGIDLNAFVSRLRNNKQFFGKLNEDQQKRIKKLNFIFDLSQHRDDTFLNHLEVFKKEHGTLEGMPFDYTTECGYKLGGKCNNTRIKYKAGKLSNEMIQKLTDIGFVFCTIQAKYDRHFKVLEKYYLEHGHLNMSRNKTLEGFNYSAHLTSLRKRMREGRLDQKGQAYVERLATIGFIEDPYTHERLETIKSIQNIIKNTGAFTKKDGILLYARLSTLKKDYLAGNLNEAVIEALKDSDILTTVSMFNLPEQDRNERALKAMIDYAKKTGHFNFSKTCKEDGIVLSTFATKLRRSIKDGASIVSKEGLRQLIEMGFDTDPLENARQQNMKMIIDFAKANPNKKPAKGSDVYKKLESFRKAYNRGALSREYVQELIQLGFVKDAK